MFGRIWDNNFKTVLPSIFICYWFEAQKCVKTSVNCVLKVQRFFYNLSSKVLLDFRPLEIQICIVMAISGIMLHNKRCVSSILPWFHHLVFTDSFACKKVMLELLLKLYILSPLMFFHLTFPSGCLKPMWVIVWEVINWGCVENGDSTQEHGDTAHEEITISCKSKKTKPWLPIVGESTFSTILRKHTYL